MVELPVESKSISFGSGEFGPGLSVPKSRKLANPIFGVYVFAAMLVLLLPFIYDIVIRASVDASSYGFKHRLHIGLNVFINIVCLVSLLRTNGDLRRRFEAAIICVFINYALLLFVLLSFRLYYSRPVLIVSFLASITLVALFNLLLEKYRERRVGIIPQGIDDDARWNAGSDADFIQSPTEPARNYDIILVDWAQITDPRWMRFATHAILSGCEVRHIASFMEIKHGRVLAEYFETDHAVSPGGFDVHQLVQADFGHSDCPSRTTP